MKIFSRAHWFNRPINVNIFHEDIDYITSISIGYYTLNLHHSAYGVGLSDKYEYLTLVEILLNDIDVTLEVFQQLGVIPFNDIDQITLSKLITYLVMK
jgi:hypothetical protein